MRYWDKMRETHEGPFTIIVDKSWEDMNVRDCFDDSCYNIEDLENKVNDGTYEWFMLRARVLLKGAEIGEHTVGGFMYENAEEVLCDGTADDVVWEAKREAKQWIENLKLVDISTLEL